MSQNYFWKRKGRLNFWHFAHVTFQYNLKYTHHTLNLQNQEYYEIKICTISNPWQKVIGGE